jgi:hypothetical protein
MFGLQGQDPGIELLLADFSFETGYALLPDRTQSLLFPKYVA